MRRITLVVIPLLSLLLFGCCPTCKKAKIRVVPAQEKTKEEAKTRGTAGKTSPSAERVSPVRSQRATKVAPARRGELAHPTSNGVKTERYSYITAEKLAEKIKKGEGFVLVDVRTPEEYAQEHIKGAVLIPYGDIPSKYERLGCKCHQIIVYSKSGDQSAIASKVLVELGFERVENLLGGIETWKKAGGKIVKGKSR